MRQSTVINASNGKCEASFFLSVHDKSSEKFKCDVCVCGSVGLRKKGSADMVPASAFQSAEFYVQQKHSISKPKQSLLVCLKVAHNDLVAKHQILSIVVHILELNEIIEMSKNVNIELSVLYYSTH